MVATTVFVPVVRLICHMWPPVDSATYAKPCASSNAIWSRPLNPEATTVAAARFMFGQAEAEQRAGGTVHDIGMHSIDAEFNVRWTVVPGADDGLDVSVGVYGADIARRANVGNVKLVGSEAIATTDGIVKPRSDGCRNR